MAISLDTDLTHLARAIALAENGRGRVSPNPLVGAVVVRDGKVLGEGWHAAYGEAHAERAALDACTADPRGATLYVSLEPCCHHGQTPPCTDAILEAGIARVVVASDDPTEKASGRGLGHPARRGRRGRGRRRRAGGARAAAQPGVPQARPHRPPARALQVGDDARRQGRHPHGRLQVDLGRGVAPALAPLARRARRGRGRHRHGAGRRPAAHRADRRARRASRAASCSTPRGGCRSTPSSCAARPSCRSPSSSAAPPRGCRPTRSRSPAPT